MKNYPVRERVGEELSCKREREWVKNYPVRERVGEELSCKRESG